MKPESEQNALPPKNRGNRNSSAGPAGGDAMPLKKISVLTIGETELNLATALGVPQLDLEVAALYARPIVADRHGNNVFGWTEEAWRLWHSRFLSEREENDTDALPRWPKAAPKNDCLALDVWTYDVPELLDLALIVNPEGAIVTVKDFYEPNGFAVPRDGVKHTVWFRF